MRSKKKVFSENHKLNILIVGAGMYVGGRGTNGYGTVLPALNEMHREGIINRIFVAATNSSSIRALKRKAKSLNIITGSQMEFEGFPKSGYDPHIYKRVVDQYNLDCAIVVVPDHLHFEIASYLIKAGIHTLVVKPLAPTVKEVKELIRLAEEKNIYGAVEFHKRYDEANLKIKDIISKKEIGDILYINVEYSQRIVIPTKVFRSWVSNTNIFQYLGVHYVDIIYFATYARPTRVLAIGQKRLLKKLGIDTYDSIQAIIEWTTGSNKFVSTILTNWIDPNTTSAMSDQKIKIIGTNGRIESDQKNRGIQIVREKTGIEDINPYFTQPYPFGERYIFKGYGIESIKQFLKDVRNIICKKNKPSDFQENRPTFKQALASTSVIEGVNLSLKRNNGWIYLK